MGKLKKDYRGGRDRAEILSCSPFLPGFHKGKRIQGAVQSFLSKEVSVIPFLYDIKNPESFVFLKILSHLYL